MSNSVYHDFRSLTKATLAGGVVAALLGLAEHIALWEDQDRLPLVARYTLGVLAYYAGIVVFVRRLGLGWLALPIFCISVAIGSAVGMAHLIRHSSHDRLDELLEDGDSHAVWMPRLGRVGRSTSQSK